jgi:hypothetical protein
MTVSTNDDQKTLLIQLVTKIDTLESKIADLQKQVEQSQRWSDRTWDVVKAGLTIAVSLSISAAIAIIVLLFRTM